MNSPLTSLAVVAATIGASSGAIMNITVDAGGNYLQNGTSNPNLSLASNGFYGSFAGGSSNDKGSNLSFLNGAITNWNTNNDPDLPMALSAAAVPADNGSIGDTNSFTAPIGYEYVVFHFGNGQAGAGGGPNNPDENGWWSAWYLDGAGGTFTLPAEGNPAQNVGGFSSARFFNTTTTTRLPDGGTTLALLAVSLLGVSGVRRIIRKD